MEELSLWEPPSTPDPVSKAAAVSVKESAGNLRRAVLMAIVNYGPISAWMLEEGLEMSGDTVRPRLWELERHGMIVKTTAKGTTPSGRACYLYVATERGRDAL